MAFKDQSRISYSRAGERGQGFSFLGKGKKAVAEKKKKTRSIIGRRALRANKLPL